MRLLVFTQKLDSGDPVLGFFHTWLKELASRLESIEVICLEMGVFNLPKNVTVYSLGKEPQYLSATWDGVWKIFAKIKYLVNNI